jgi:hypothetical protein
MRVTIFSCSICRAIAGAAIMRREFQARSASTLTDWSDTTTWKSPRHAMWSSIESLRLSSPARGWRSRCGKGASIEYDRLPEVFKHGGPADFLLSIEWTSRPVRWWQPEFATSDAIAATEQLALISQLRLAWLPNMWPALASIRQDRHGIVRDGQPQRAYANRAAKCHINEPVQSSRICPANHKKRLLAADPRRQWAAPRLGTRS